MPAHVWNISTYCIDKKMHSIKNLSETVASIPMMFSYFYAHAHSRLPVFEYYNKYLFK